MRSRARQAEQRAFRYIHPDGGSVRRQAAGRSRGRGTAPSGGFTLIELLITIGIIAILAGMLVPVAGKARQAANSTLCQSNLHQIGIAMSMYINDHNGHCMPIQNSTLSYWFGERTTSERSDPKSRVFDRTKGYLYPYLKVTRAVAQCPGFEQRTRFDGKLVGYAYNWYQRFELGWPHSVTYRKGLGPGVMYGHIRRPAKMVVMVDGARISNGNPSIYYTPAGTVEENYYLAAPAPMDGYPCVHFRHNGKANALFADWHVEQLEPRSIADGGDGHVGHFCDSSDWEQYYCR